MATLLILLIAASPLALVAAVLDGRATIWPCPPRSSSLQSSAASGWSS
jgi:hypothetical protein